MTCRVENGVVYKQYYNAENHISSIAKVDGNCETFTVIESWSFAYDGDGVRTMTVHDAGGNISITRYYFGRNCRSSWYSRYSSSRKRA
jgi:hypothetical protein